MAIFVHVVECGSFTKAADVLRLGKSVVSAHVAALESKLGVQLIARSTRSLTLTTDGRAFLDECRQMLASAEAAMTAIDSRALSVSGLIRLTASYNLGIHYLIPQLAAFRAEHPGITIDLVLDDSVSNIIDNGFDMAIRVGRLVDSSLYATELATCRLLVCATPSLVQALGPINEPEQLVNVPWISIAQLPHPDRLNLVHRETSEMRSVSLGIVARTTSGIAAREFVCSGAGFSALPDYAVASALKSGSLVEVLPKWRELENRPITALFPSRAGMPSRVRELVAFLRDRFSVRANPSS